MADKPKTEIVAVGNRIREIRKSLGLSMEEFGKILSPTASKGAVSNWENGYNLPNNSRLKTISEKGGVSVLYLLEGKKTFNDLSDEEKRKEAKKLKNNLMLSNRSQGFSYINDISNIDFSSFSYNSLRSVSYYINLVNNFNKNDTITSNLATFSEYLTIYAFENHSTEQRELIKEDLLSDFNNILNILNEYNKENII